MSKKSLSIILIAFSFVFLLTACSKDYAGVKVSSDQYKQLSKLESDMRAISKGYSNIDNRNDAKAGITAAKDFKKLASTYDSSQSSYSATKETMDGVISDLDSGDDTFDMAETDARIIKSDSAGIIKGITKDSVSIKQRIKITEHIFDLAGGFK